jgi:hypothetical protein
VVDNQSVNPYIPSEQVAQIKITNPRAGNSISVLSLENTGSEWQMRTEANGDFSIHSEIYAHGGLGPILTIDNQTGNIGIKNPNPGRELDINGQLRYTAGGTAVEMTRVYPTYYEFSDSGSLWGVTKWASSKRFKENISDLEIDSSKIYNLKPVSFNWKPERGGYRDFGLIAEDVAGVEPLLVAYDKEGKPFLVRYEMLSVLNLDQLQKIRKGLIVTENGNVGIGTEDPGADKLDVRGRAYASGGWQTTNADYAEWFEKEEEDTAPGDIIGINLITGKARRYRPGDKFVGIQASNPGVVGNRIKETDEEMAKTHILVSLLGQVDFNRSQVEINGRIVTTKDGKEIGILLSNGKLLIGK